MKIKLKAKLMAATLAVLIAIAVVITSLLFNQMRSLQQQSILTGAEAQSISFASYLSGWVADRRNTLTAMATAIEDHYIVGGSFDHGEILKIINLSKNAMGFSLTYLGLEDGTMYRNDPELDRNRRDYDPRVREWYKATKKAMRNTVTEPYVTSTGSKLAVTIAEPVVVNGRLFGVVAADIYLQEVVENILDLTVQGEGYAVLVDNTNIVVAHPNSELIMQKTKVLNSWFADHDVADLGINSLHDIDVLDEGTLLYVSDIANTNWKLILVMKKEILGQPVNALLTKISLVTIGLLALASAGFVLIIRWLLSDLTRISEALGSIANGKGDLTSRVVTESRDEVGELANNFNKFVEYLHGMISRVMHVSEELLAQVHATSESTLESAESVNTQQHDIGQVSTSMNRMDDATQDIARNSSSAASMADRSVELSNQGQEQVRKSRESINALATQVSSTNDVIGTLDKHAKEISSILATISGIAEQTNLLALNAAIEAARAGEQGRGFAVVADEVRVLSQRTHDSTAEIQTMIEALQKTTHNAVTSMESSQCLADTSVTDAETASESLNLIRDSITAIRDMATQIATAAEEQSSVTRQININTTNIDTASKHLAQQTEENAKRFHTVSDLTDALKDDLKHFTL